MDLIGFALVFLIVLLVAYVGLAVSLSQKKAWVLLGLLVVVPFMGACLLAAGALLLAGQRIESGPGEFDSSPTAPAFLDQPTLERAYEDGIAQVRLEEAQTSFEDWLDRSEMPGVLEVTVKQSSRSMSEADGRYLSTFNLKMTGTKKAFDRWFAELEQRPGVKLVSLSMTSPEGGADVVAQLELELRSD